MNTGTSGAHTHSVSVSGTVTNGYVSSISGVGAHTHTFTGTYTNNSQASINVQNPYTVVYMYKRIS